MLSTQVERLLCIVHAGSGTDLGSTKSSWCAQRTKTTAGTIKDNTLSARSVNLYGAGPNLLFSAETKITNRTF